MKKTLSCLVAMAIALTGVAKQKAQPVNPDSTGFKFKDVKVVPANPIENQYKTGTCWCYSTCAFLEHEIFKATGKKVNLSEMFVVHHAYADKARKYQRMGGKINFQQGGSCLDVPYVWANYGIVPKDVYSGQNYGEELPMHSELVDGMVGYLDGVMQNRNKRFSTAWHNGLVGILDAYLGKLPETFVYEGVEYTPKSFAESLKIKMDDYVPLMSWTHHPFYEKSILEMPDNWLWGEYYNIPLDEFKEVVDNAIDNGYTVAWAADISEGGWQWNNGFAIYPEEKNPLDMEGTDYARWSKLTTAQQEKEKWQFDGPVPEKKVTQEMRQAMYENQETTDDHGMVIVGRAVDQKGNKYYKVQNSWGDNQLYGGYIYVSEPYFLAKTMDVVVNKKAIPEKIAKKLNLK